MICVKEYDRHPRLFIHSLEQSLKMKLNKIFLLILVLASSHWSCSKEDKLIDTTELLPIGNAISGSVLNDIDDDGIGDRPVEARIYIGNSADIWEVIPGRPDTFPEPYNQIYWTDTDEDGNYEVTGLIPFENKSIHIYTAEVLDVIEGTDVTPDGDFLETEIEASINVSIEEEEIDDGNNFILQISDLGIIEGQITIDKDKDGTVDGNEAGVKLWLSRSDDNGYPTGLALDTAYSDGNGFYRFSDVFDGDYVVSFGSTQEYTVTSSGDDSADDDLTNPTLEFIPVSIVEEEQDTDNNFQIEYKWRSISGNVLEDTNEDGEGDLGANNQRIELYHRNEQGVPMGSLVAFSYTDFNGSFNFFNLDPGEYVIFNIGSIDFICVSSSDTSPEPDEPTDNQECFFIQTDVNTIESEDSGNVFVVKAN